MVAFILTAKVNSVSPSKDYLFFIIWGLEIYTKFEYMLLFENTYFMLFYQRDGKGRKMYAYQRAHTQSCTHTHVKQLKEFILHPLVGGSGNGLKLPGLLGKPFVCPESTHFNSVCVEMKVSLLDFDYFTKDPVKNQPEEHCFLLLTLCVASMPGVSSETERSFEGQPSHCPFSVVKLPGLFCFKALKQNPC